MSIAIQAPLIFPPVHPRDKNLLRPLSELGKPKYQPGGISFLRRTEYISSEASRSRSEAVAKNAAKSTTRVRKPIDTSKDEPINVLRAAVKGFDIANADDIYTGPDSKENIRGAEPSPAEMEAWKNPKHPFKPELKLLDVYPMKPDLDAMTDSASYLVAKFAANPTQSVDKRDDRMDVGLLHPIEVKEAVIAEHRAKMEAHEANPSQNPHPGGLPYSYNFFLPANENSTTNVKRKFNVNDPARDDTELYTDMDKNEHGVFHYEHLRTYETARSTIDAQYSYKEVALGLHDTGFETKTINGSSDIPHERLEKAAYYYPISQKVQLKPHRNKNLAHMGMANKMVDDDDDDRIDALDVMVRDLNELEQERRAQHRSELLESEQEDHGNEIR